MRLLVVVPALNEEGAIGDVVASIRRAMPGSPVLVLDDCSADSTALQARAAGAEVISLPAHGGIGACMRVGYQKAWDRGYEYAVRVDGDGQHEPGDIPLLLETMARTSADVVIGSRFIPPARWPASGIRMLGIGLFRRLLSQALGQAVYDPTSGFVAVNRKAMAVCAGTLPRIYPEIGTLLMLRRRGLRFSEVACRMYQRKTGRSSFTFFRSCRYVLEALTGIAVSAVRDGTLFGRRPRHGFESE